MDFKKLISKEVIDVISLGNNEICFIVNLKNPERLSKLGKIIPAKKLFEITPNEFYQKFNEYFLEGYSHKNDKFLFETAQLKKKKLIEYSLENLPHSKKTLFGYALKGRKKGEGILNSIKGETIGRNSILIPENGLDSIEEFLNFWNIKYATRALFISAADNKQKKVNR